MKYFEKEGKIGKMYIVIQNFFYVLTVFSFNLFVKTNIFKLPFCLLNIKFIEIPF